MTVTVTITSASYRNNPVENVTLPLIKAFRATPGDVMGSGTITVDGTSLGFDNRIRLRVTPDQFTINGQLPVIEKNFHVGDVAVDEKIPLEGEWNGETEVDAINRINERFEILNEMAQAIAFGSVKSVIVSGPPGVGKSHGVEETLQICCGAEYLASGVKPYEVIKGTVSPIGLYIRLHEYSDAGKVIVFDDSDDCLMDPICLALLKTALDTSKRRVLSWNKESHALKDTGVPNRFEFKGGIIFITNLDFAGIRSKMLKPHLDALMSRSHYLTLSINNQRDKYLRIKGVVMSSDMMDDYSFDKKTRDSIMTYIRTNIHKLNELSLCTVIKLSDLVKMKNGKGWEKIANITLLRHGA